MAGDSVLDAVLQRILPGADLDIGPVEGLGALGPDFAALSDDEQDRRLRAVEADRWFRALVQRAAEAHYGRRGSPAWAELGYDEGPHRSPDAPITFPVPRTTPVGAVADAYDAVVIGAGAGGGMAASVLARAGLQVLVAERGRLLPHDPDTDHAANHRLALRGHNTGPPAPEPRVFDGRVVERPWDGRWGNNAMTVGGGTRVYQGMAWRLHPDDFSLASSRGVPDGSSLADWPITYEELDPHYERVEWDLGVCGDGAAHRVRGPRARDYPMPPFPLGSEGRALAAAAARLGWSTGPVPMLINSVPRDGRARCVGCGHCVGFTCPSDAKNGSHNVLLPRAVDAGAVLTVDVRCEHVTADGVVTLRDLTTGARRTVRAGHVVLAAGAVESARLLLASALGGPNVGLHLQGHVYPSVFAHFEDPVVDMEGPGNEIATLDHYYGPDGALGGALHDDGIKWPLLHWHWAQAPDAPRWGRAAMDSMRHGYRRTSHLFGPVQEVPTPDLRVTLAEDVRDRFGCGVASLHGRVHPETVRAARWLQDRAVEWFEAADGVARVWRAPVVRGTTGGQHQAGTCRMGDDPATSVTDRWGRVHGHRNLWVMDGSVHVTNGGVNPVLTILALAHRAAEHLTRQ